MAVFLRSLQKKCRVPKSHLNVLLEIEVNINLIVFLPLFQVFVGLNWSHYNLVKYLFKHKKLNITLD